METIPFPVRGRKSISNEKMWKFWEKRLEREKGESNFVTIVFDVLVSYFWLYSKTFAPGRPFSI